MAIQRRNSIAIIDELLARRMAEIIGLKYTGTMGVILKAKREGLITAVEPILNELLQCGFRLSDRLIEDVLKLAGETNVSE